MNIIAFGIVLYGLWILKAILSWHQRDFFPRDKRDIRNRKSVPFIRHFGVWSEFFLLNPLLLIITDSVSYQWKTQDYITFAIVALIINMLLQTEYMVNGEPDCFTKDQYLTHAGTLNAVYTWIVLTIVMLFFLKTSQVPSFIIVCATGILMLHLPLASHAVAAIMTPQWTDKKPYWRDRKSLGKLLIYWLAILVLAVLSAQRS